MPHISTMFVFVRVRQAYCYLPIRLLLLLLTLIPHYFPFFFADTSDYEFSAEILLYSLSNCLNAMSREDLFCGCYAAVKLFSMTE